MGTTIISYLTKPLIYIITILSILSIGTGIFFWQKNTISKLNTDINNALIAKTTAESTLKQKTDQYSTTIKQLQKIYGFDIDSLKALNEKNANLADPKIKERIENIKATKSSLLLNLINSDTKCEMNNFYKSGTCVAGVYHE